MNYTPIIRKLEDWQLANPNRARQWWIVSTAQGWQITVIDGIRQEHVALPRVMFTEYRDPDGMLLLQVDKLLAKIEHKADSV